MLSTYPQIDEVERVISFPVPKALEAVDNFGYAHAGDVDDRYMPPEVVGTGRILKFTDRAGVVTQAIAHALTDQKAWPEMQYLWDVHPIMDWLNDRAAAFFGRRGVPLCRLQGRLGADETAVLLHGVIPNRVGTSVVDAWGLVRVREGEAGPVELVAPFLAEMDLMGDVPNQGNAAPQQAMGAIAPAVSQFQWHLVERRKAREAQLDADLTGALEHLSGFERRFADRLQTDFGDIVPGFEPANANQSRRLRRREAREREFRQMFADLERWHEDNCKLADDPNPFVDVCAVFQG